MHFEPGKGYISYIMNPKSGASSIKLTSRLFLKYLRDKGYEVKLRQTESLDHACELGTDAAVDYECSLVVVSGGDGTIREVAQGLEGSDKPLIVVPCGTENLLANELGYDEKLETLKEAFENGQVRRLDLGKINGRCFTSVAGFGFDGAVVNQVHKEREGHIDYLDYFYPLWRTFWRHDFPPMRVEVDGAEIFDGRGLVFVGNISRYAMGLQIMRYADYGDGQLDICIYKCGGRLRLIKHSINTVLKQHADSRDVIYRHGKTVRINSEHKDIYTELDGDPGPPLPVNIRIIPQAVNVITPPGAKPAGIRTRLIRAIG